MQTVYLSLRADVYFLLLSSEVKSAANCDVVMFFHDSTMQANGIMIHKLLRNMK